MNSGANSAGCFGMKNSRTICQSLSNGKQMFQRLCPDVTLTKNTKIFVPYTVVHLGQFPGMQKSVWRPCSDKLKQLGIHFHQKTCLFQKEIY